MSSSDGERTFYFDFSLLIRSNFISVIDRFSQVTILTEDDCHIEQV
jgi:hypothetical protein